MRQETMIELRDMIWAYRHRLADRWPTPLPLDALRFAFTEAAEAMDARLRLRLQPAYNRNNAKALSVEDELADCMMMLITALGEEWQPPIVGGYAATLEGICAAVGDCLQSAAWESIFWQKLVVIAIVKIDAYLDADPVTLVKGRLERIEGRVSGAAN